MYICICNAITKEQIINSQNERSKTLDEIKCELGVGLQCGICLKKVIKLLQSTPKHNQLLPNTKT
jgi:bacterioferritin-associated ferredoxin